MAQNEIYFLYNIFDFIIRYFAISGKVFNSQYTLSASLFYSFSLPMV